MLETKAITVSNLNICVCLCVGKPPNVQYESTAGLLLLDITPPISREGRNTEKNYVTGRRFYSLNSSYLVSVRSVRTRTLMLALCIAPEYVTNAEQACRRRNRLAGLRRGGRAAQCTPCTQAVRAGPGARHSSCGQAGAYFGTAALATGISGNGKTRGGGPPNCGD